MVRSPRSILILTALGALGACTSASNLPANNAPMPTASTSTTTTTTTQPVVTTANGATIVSGTLVTPPPGTVMMMPSSGSSTVTVTTPAPRLSNLELLTLLSGSTASGTASDGNPYYAHFQRSGRVDLHEANYAVETGTWRVTDDGQLCSALSNVNAGIEQCYTIYRSGTGYVYERPDGHPVGGFAIQPGA